MIFFLIKFEYKRSTRILQIGRPVKYSMYDLIVTASVTVFVRPMCDLGKISEYLNRPEREQINNGSQLNVCTKRTDEHQTARLYMFAQYNCGLLSHRDHCKINFSANKRKITATEKSEGTTGFNQCTL